MTLLPSKIDEKFQTIFQDDRLASGCASIGKPFM
jgi:hypothetical protein